MKKLRVCRVDTCNGEIHFIVEENMNAECSEHFEDSDLDEIKIVSKREADKPLVLLRNE